MLANDPNVTLDGVIKTIQRAQMILAESDEDGLKATMVEPVLRIALEHLTEVREMYRTRRRRKD